MKSIPLDLLITVNMKLGRDHLLVDLCPRRSDALSSSARTSPLLMKMAHQMLLSQSGTKREKTLRQKLSKIV